MTITINNLGAWVRYTPTTPPEGAPANTMFCQRVSDNVDWYTFSRNPANFASANSIKAIVDPQNTVQACYRDPSYLFPQNCTLIEIVGDDANTDPQSTYGQQVYNATTNTISAPPPAVPQFIMRRQFFQQLSVQGIITQADALSAVQTGTIPSALQTLVNGLPTAEQFGATMMISGDAMFARANPITIAIGTAYGWTSAQMDAFFTAAATL